MVSHRTPRSQAQAQAEDRCPALLMYKPHDPRYARALGRFPKRNRFISDFIYEQTGVRRSPKQVGSRLQQLKDVACGKKRKYQ